MQRIGLTGGIGSGKSTVLAMLARRGAATVDADALSRAVTAPGGAAIPAISRTFGPHFVASDGSLDRTRMRSHVYANEPARRQLEAIIHPLVQASIQEADARALADGARCMVYDVPLLVESGRWRPELDRVVVVDCEAAIQIQRVMARSQLDAQQVHAIIAAQAPRAARLAAADVVIFNQGLSFDQLQAQVDELACAFGL